MSNLFTSNVSLYILSNKEIGRCCHICKLICILFRTYFIIFTWPAFPTVMAKQEAMRVLCHLFTCCCFFSLKTICQVHISWAFVLWMYYYVISSHVLLLSCRPCCQNWGCGCADLKFVQALQTNELARPTKVLANDSCNCQLYKFVLTIDSSGVTLFFSGRKEYAREPPPFQYCDKLTSDMRWE